MTGLFGFEALAIMGRKRAVRSFSWRRIWVAMRSIATELSDPGTICAICCQRDSFGMHRRSYDVCVPGSWKNKVVV